MPFTSNDFDSLYRAALREDLEKARIASMADDDGLAATEAAYERHLENRGSDHYYEEELRAWDEEWPNGYGLCREYTDTGPCRLSIYHPGGHIGCTCNHHHDDIDAACPLHGAQA